MNHLSNGFFEDVYNFNKAFNLPTPATPTMVITHAERAALALRLQEFSIILLDEVDEVNEVIKGLTTDATALEAVVNLADWLGDVIVYCTSEAMRHGIPIEQVLTLIMASQYSKLTDDGTPLYSGGKVQKGPNFKPPEEAIAALLAATLLGAQK